GATAIGPLPDGTAQAVQALRALKPQAIVLMAPALRAAAFARAWRASGETAHLLGFSRVDHQQVLALAGSAVARGMGFTQVVPYPYAGSSPLAREYRALLAVYGPMDAAPGYAGFEAFIGAKVLVEALQRAGGAGGAGSVAAALEQLGMLDLGGFVVRYGKDERQGSHYVDFTVTGSEGQLLR
ncbi:MAG: ABC transporter substrate-binding protein, partial [Comamonadaceae bacterium]|nr:ABC transporter substrate-binding protein [Comamonadaceae bacterium]